MASLARHFSSAINPKNPNLSSRNVLSLLKSETNPNRILEICRSASLNPESHSDRIALSVAISNLHNSRSFDAVRSLIDGLRSSLNHRNEWYASHLIVLYGEARMLDRSMRAFEQIDRRTARSLNALLFACILAKKHDQVTRIFREYQKIYHIEPDIDTFNTVIKSLCESGSSSCVYSILAEMDRKGYKPNATSYNTLIAGFYKEEKYKDVEKVLNLMVKNKCRLGIGTYNVRIQSLCKLKRSVEAKALLDGMLSRGMKPNSVTYHHLIHGFCREGDLEEAKRLFYEMGKKGYVPDSNCYFTLVYYLCDGGDFDTASQICKESMAKGWVPKFTTMNALVHGLVSISKLEEARQLVGQVKGRFSRNVGLWNEVEGGLLQ